jgi:hypothetical protein
MLSSHLQYAGLSGKCCIFIDIATDVLSLQPLLCCCCSLRWGHGKEKVGTQKTIEIPFFKVSPTSLVVIRSLCKICPTPRVLMIYEK